MAERTFQQMLNDTNNIKNTIKASLSLERNMDNVKFSQYPDIIKGLVTKHWGFRIAKADSNPDTSVTYLYDAVGKNPGRMTFDGNGVGTFGWGDWKPFVDSFFRPVMLKYDGTVDYELSHEDQTKRIDGVTASDIGNASYDGNAMVEIRRIWTKITEDTNYIYVEFSNVQLDENFSAEAFRDSSGTLKDCAYYSMFEGSYQNSKLRSLASGSVMAGQTGSTEISRAEANGSGWYITPYSLHNLVALLHVLVSKNLNTQAMFGNGNSNNSSYIAPGSLKSYGAFKGYSDETHAVKTFYIENFWANYWMRCAGLLLCNRGTDASPDYQITYKSKPPYNNTGDGYVNCGRGPTSNNYLKSVKPISNAVVPLAVGGSSTTYFSDYYYQANPTVAEPKYALVGGARSHGASCGAFSVYLRYALSASDAYIGARLSFL